MSRTDHFAKCRSCNAEIFWTLTVNGKRMPVDSEPVRNGGFILKEDTTHTPPLLHATVVVPSDRLPPDRRRYVSHFATCKQAGDWRKSQ
jgi:hypothetical protein